ncbi:MAG: type I restriction enzyme HsdR N-terminal domain-containing protein [Cyclobacteriaceae bacterium]
MQSNLYQDFDFTLLNNPEFKEDSVREELILPFLKKLSYKPFGRNRIIRSKTLSHPFVKTGTSKRNVTSIPDYLFEVNGEYSWVLDAKGPNEEIKSGEHLEQAYFYAIHPEIRVNYFALCNGNEFLLHKVDEKTPTLYFHLEELDNYWHDIKQFLSPDAFVQESILLDPKEDYQSSDFDYNGIQVPKPIVVKKQAAKRHFGVHGYFTKQAWNVVAHYIKTFSKPGDLILDPFGGSGVTLIESMMLDRSAIHIDLNPLSAFLTEALTAPVSVAELTESFDRVCTSFEKKCPKSENEINETLNKYWYPKGISLTKDADVETIEELFTDQQLAELALLRDLIIKEKDKNIKNSLLLSFSSTVTKINRTYHSSSSRGENAGNAAAFAYYRYRMAKQEVHLSTLDSFKTKFKKLVAAKNDISNKINSVTIENATIIKGDATDLSSIENESIDYIYTDPPYGSKIAYLDLSAMWNAWLGFDITEEDYQKEAIEGGSLKKSSDEYGNLLSKSIEEMFRVLKFDRWMSFVFAHKDPQYWHLIVETAEKVGFEYAGAVKQSNGQSSFKKRQNPFSVLSGQLIINFKKARNQQTIQKVRLGSEIYDLIIETIESVIAEHDGATLEQINDELILKGLELGFLDVLSKEYKDLTPILLDHFDYHEETDTFHIRVDKKFRTNIPLDLRIRYFLLSYLRRKEQEQVFPTTDEIILDIMPLLKNGITPENQTILKVLERIGEHKGDEKWGIKRMGQINLFD